MHRFALTVLLTGTAMASGPAFADSHGVVIVNGSGATIREIHISPPGAGPGANRLRSTLPSRATAEITYSTGCRADLTLRFEDGQSERFADQDVCAGLRIVAGQDLVTTAAPSRSPKAATAMPSFKPPHVNVPWTGRSITHKFGGLN